MNIRYAFQSRTSREKILVLFMMVVALVIWLSLFAGRASAVLDQRASLNADIREQRAILDNRESIRERARRGIEQLDPSRTLNATRLMGEADAIARRYGFNPSINTPRTTSGDVFSYHTVQLSVRRAEIADLINFTSELQTRAPYIGLEQVRITADRNDPALLNADFRISSVELNP